MRIHIDDRRLCKSIVRHFRARGYLAVERGPGTIEVVPIDAGNEKADRARTLADLEEWATGHEGVTATPVENGG
jgi:hypothetical protein